MTRLGRLLSCTLFASATACARNESPQRPSTVDAILFDSAQIVLNSTKLADAVRLLGPASITYVSEGVAGLVCYRLSGEPAAFVFLESNGIAEDLIVTADISRVKPNRMPEGMQCVPSPRHVRELSTTFGFSLGMARASIHNVLGSPGSVSGDTDDYDLGVDTSATAVPKRLRPVFLTLTFQNDSLSYVIVSKGSWITEEVRAETSKGSTARTAR